LSSERKSYLTWSQ